MESRYRTLIKNLMLSLIFVLGIAPACATTPAVAPTQPASSPTPTPTRMVIFPSEAPETTVPRQVEIEIRIPYSIFSQGEASSTEVPECVNTIPINIIEQEERILVEGEGPIKCVFTFTPEGVPFTYHIELRYTGSLNGEMLPVSIDKPAGWLDAYLIVDGVLTQYYTDYPAEATNPCPQSNPCSTPIFDTIPLPLDYEDGSTISTPWIFLLKLE
jgi:hypothetical protein